ncbi:S-layer homology domain-containing protein [Caldanaerobius fijiensis DSM 17918]|uniref:S-layer homology domain-containing protein n=1 Tax=Caldanaerobius fijiensis DSM 17918 TaxID=1121256 RepID=A0A1M4URD4_9THEO|nr:S-layer homology domain-containing protein [Caldanaerobius fijiensis]SHE59245.1 S-layer homology domain-containing protein [Caldanaerobius fijiensis DSM 17918]
MRRLIAILLVVILSTLQVLGFGAQIYQGTEQAKYLVELSRFKDIENNWAKKPIKVLTALSIFRGYGDRFYPDRIITYEEALIVALRAAGQEENAQRYMQTLKSRPGGTTSNGVQNRQTAAINADPWAYGYVDYAISKGILSKADATIPWTKPAQRQVVAYWLAKLAGVAPIYGTEQGAIYNFSDWRDINEVYAPYIEPLVRIGAIKGSISGNSLKFRPEDSLARNEMASMVYILLPYFAKVQGIVSKGGIIVRTSSRYVDNAPVKDYYIENDDGSRAVIEIKQDFDVPVLNGDDIDLTSWLKNGDNITYYAKGNNILFIELNAGSNNANRVEGVILDVSQDQLTLEDSSGNTRIYTLSKYTPVDVNGLAGSLSDLKYGQSVSLKLVNGRVKSISVYIDNNNPGYVTPGTIRVYGQVLDIIKSGDGYALRIYTQNGDIKDYYVSENIPVLMPQKTGSIQDVLRGDFVALYLDSLNSATPSKIAVQSNYGQVVAVIKGNIKGYANGQLALSDVKRYENGTWVDESGYAFYGISNDAKLYVDGNKIIADDINNYKSMRAYAVLTNNYGGSKIGYLNVFKGYEYTYEYTLSSIDYAAQRITVGNNVLPYNSSTAVVNSDRLMPPEGLVSGEDLLVIASKDGNNSIARLVLVETPQWPPYMIFKGNIVADAIKNQYGNIIGYNGIYDDRFELVKSYILKSGQWEKTGDEYLYLNNDTNIVDNTSTPGRSITLRDFTSMRYNDSNMSYLRGKFIYVVSDAFNNTIAINVVGDAGDFAGSGDRITTAYIDAVDAGNGLLSLKNARDYSQFKSSWFISGADMINVKKAVIVKNGMPVGLNDINPGDEAFIVRDGSIGYVVIVR